MPEGSALVPLGLLVPLAVVAAGLRIVSDHERVVETRAGRPSRIRGPGLLLRVPFPLSRWVRVRLGDRGTLRAPGVAVFHNAEAPVFIESAAATGERIRVVGFRGQGREATIVATLDR